MRVYVVFEFPEINDTNGQRADNEIDMLMDELKTLDVGCQWWVDDITCEE